MTLLSDIDDIVPQNVKKFSAKFAKSLGIFGSVLGGIGSFFTPTPNDIIAACNKAIKKLTDEVNAQFVNMQAYIDQNADYDYFLNNVENAWRYDDHDDGTSWHDTQGIKCLFNLLLHLHVRRE